MCMAEKGSDHEMITPAMQLFYKWLKLSLACSAEYDVQCNMQCEWEDAMFVCMLT